MQKKQRWEETELWARSNQCEGLIVALTEIDFYCVDLVTTYTVGPSGGPTYLEWNFESKKCPSPDELLKYFAILQENWAAIAGLHLAEITRPASFTGKKARRLIVAAKQSARAPWGEWHRLSCVESQRREFTDLRKAINRAISPHQVDHIDFVTE